MAAPASTPIRLEPRLESVRSTRERLIANGYQPVRVRTHSKQPLGKQWQLGEPRDQLLQADQDLLNTGILGARLRCLDVDVDEPKVAAAIKKEIQARFPGALIRTRANSPRFAAVVGAASGEPGKRSIAGPAGKLEALGAGQQFVAHGVHPSRALIEWENERGPDTVPRDQLPAVTEEQIDELLTVCAPLLGSTNAATGPTQVVGIFEQPFAQSPMAANNTGPVEDELGAGVEPPEYFDRLNAPEKRAFVEACLNAIENRVNDPYDVWFRILFATADAGMRGCPDAEQLARDWSRRGRGWTCDADFDRTWHSWKPGKVQVGSLISAAKGAGFDVAPWRDLALSRLNPQPAQGPGAPGQLPTRVTTAPVGPAVVDYVPGNERACREALDLVVSEDPNTFKSGSLLIILRIPSQTDLPENTDWASDFPGTTLATPADIMERAERLHWRRRAGGKGDPRLLRVHPPASFINNYLPQMRDRYGARPLLGIARVPVVERSGEVRFPKGYDAVTGLFHDQTPIFELPANPSYADALASAQILFEPFSEYKFTNSAAGAAIMLGAIFTALERPFLGTAPMLIIRCSMPGTGKGLIIRCLVWLAYGSLPVLMTWGNSKEEFEKRLASILITSPAAFSIDNANGMQIEGELLESIITEGSADIRLLGRSEMVRVRNSSLITLTGNNPTITGDMARRALPIDIVPRSADPERDKYPFDPFELVQARRTEFLMHAFTVMRAYRLAGMPESGLPAVGSFGAWSRRVRDLIYWLNGHDVSEVFHRNKAEDPQRQGDGALLAALHRHFGWNSFKSAEPVAVYQRALDARRPQGTCPSLTPSERSLADAFDDAFGNRGVNARQFGQWARRIKGAHTEGFILDIKHDPAANSNVCTVGPSS